MTPRLPHGGEVAGAKPGNLVLAPLLRRDCALSLTPQRDLLDLQAIQRIPGLVGYWKADPQYLFEDSAGTTPASTSGTGPVGQWRAVGVTPTLTAVTVANSGFDADSDWTKGTGWTIGSGVATKTAGSAASLSQAITLTAGSVYLITWTLTRTAGTLLPRFTGGTTVSGTALSASGTYTENLVAVTGNTTLEFYGNATFAGTVDDVSVVLLTGVVAVEATTALKPILRKTPTTGVYWADSNTSTSALNVALGNLGSACTVARSGAEGVTFTENVSITSTYNIAPAYGFNSDVAIFNRALTATEKALITRYMQRAVPLLGAETIANGNFESGVPPAAVDFYTTLIAVTDEEKHGAYSGVATATTSVAGVRFVKITNTIVLNAAYYVTCNVANKTFNAFLQVGSKMVSFPNVVPSTFRKFECVHYGSANPSIQIGSNGTISDIAGTKEFVVDDISVRAIL